MNGLFANLLKAGPARVIAGLGLAAIAAALLFTVTLRMGEEANALLYANLEIAEAGEITERLEQASIPFKLSADGGTVFVPRGKVLEARMMLSAEGLPTSGSIGYEIFDKQGAFGSTQFQQSVNKLRALEGELARTIVSLQGVKSARVHLVIPERKLFDQSRDAPTASIVINSVTPLEAAQVRAVRNLVAGAVPGLSAQRVTVLDAEGRLLAAASDDGGANLEAAADARATTEERLRKTVQNIVESVVGPGAARVQVAVEMDFNKITENSESFDPDGRVVRSTQSIEETSAANDAASRAATAANNIPDGAGGEGPGSSEQANRTEETVNYEISRRTRTEVIEGGRIKRISVAVAVDGVTKAGAEGSPPAWAPREQSELDRISALVKSTVGFDAERGDQVEVVNLQFARLPMNGTEAKAPGLLDAARLDAMRIIEIVAALIAALALVLFVLRPLAAAVARGPAAVGKGGAATMLAIEGSSDSVSDAEAASAAPSAISADVARIKGDLRESSVRQIADIVEQHPEESVSIVRGWLSNAA